MVVVVGVLPVLVLLMICVAAVFLLWLLLLFGVVNAAPAVGNVFPVVCFAAAVVLLW